MADDRSSRPYLDLLFFTGFALLACHELDAVAQAEWRMLPILSWFDAHTAYSAFVLLHIPLFALLMWAAGSTSRRIRFRAQLGLDAFLVIHAVLHALLSGHEHNTFHSNLSSLCIYGAAAVGVAHLGLTLRARPYSGRKMPERSGM